ncbi:MAG: tetratricopeptide repeat protein [Luteitalea sp.]|nr:tetratricopeptide repeat protein [Luteitalea sp.]
MGDYIPLLSALIALLAGLAAGKAWERYKLHEGRWIDRRKARQSPHYIQGLNFLANNQIDHAIEELGQAAHVDTEAAEIHMILGNLYREKGQVGRAIEIHQQVLQRPRLTKLEHTYGLLCLGVDFRRAGFVDRAREAFAEVLRLDPSNEHALLNLQRLHEDQRQWDEAYRIRQHLVQEEVRGAEDRHQEIQAFLENELGLEAVRRRDFTEAIQWFEKAIERAPGVLPTYLHLGDVYHRQGQVAAAVAIWERLIEAAPDRAYLAFDRLSAAYTAGGAPHQFETLCRRLMQTQPQDWRARVALGRHLAAHGAPSAAFEVLLAALRNNPHALGVHQAVWETLMQLGLDRTRVKSYMEQSQDAVFYRDPHICVRCRYRSDELLWRCPHCHEWNSFVEDRLSPAKERDEIAT